MFIDQIYQCISEISNTTPDKIAIHEAGYDYTYLQFKQGIDCCRLQLINLQEKEQLSNIIGLYCDNSFLSHCAIHACALERITYVPLSVTDPVDRILTIIRIAKIEFVLFDQTYLKKINSFFLSEKIERLRVIEINTKWENKILISKQKTPSDLYILFTSGSTGHPKGVAIRHQSVENYLNWAGHYLSISSGDIFFSHSRITFDLSVFNLFLPFMFGASTVLARSLSDQTYPGELLKKNITIALIVPRVTNLLIQSKQLFKNSFPTLRHVLFCGEQLFAHQVRSWMNTNDFLTVHNIYGPTETTVTCTYHTIRPGETISDPVPIGKVIPNMRIEFLDEKSNVISTIKYEAEAIISGIGVSDTDYIGQESNRFFSHATLGRSFRSGDILYRNSNHILYWRSRVDFQLKIRGYRVELSEIEIVLMSSKKINDVVCIYKSDTEKLYAFVELENMNDNVESDLRKIATEQLPEYMNPTIYIFLAQLPRNQNGKIDRANLFENCT